MGRGLIHQHRFCEPKYGRAMTLSAAALARSVLKMESCGSSSRNAYLPTHARVPNLMPTSLKIALLGRP